MNKNNFDINIEFNKIDIINKSLYLKYDIKISKLTDEKIGKEIILREIKKKIPKGEEKYLNIKKFSNKEVIFEFDVDKWFDSKNKLVDTESRYVKKLLLNRLPSMILNNVNAIDYTRIIQGSFRNYLNKNTELKNKISKNFPLSYFRFKYDGVQNSIRIEVKEEFRHNILAILNTKENKKINKMDFDSSVEAYLKLKKLNK